MMHNEIAKKHQQQRERLCDGFTIQREICNSNFAVANPLIYS